ncbi:protein serine/threonine phosphatase 2C, partial [Fragilariopsis cylindrus CCMP1102]
YAFRSQRGYNSQYPLKSNQEKYSITLNFASESGDGVIGVFSGHGENGQQCANFSQRVLPQQLAKFGAWNPNAWPLLNTNEFEQCCRRAFNGTNKMSHEENEVDDELSGTSAAIVCFHGGRMTVCNVGDCREQRYRPEGEVFAIPMTKDHTLLCQEELERIKKAGAEVELINQIEDTDLAFNSLNGVSSVEREESPLLLQIPGKPYTGTKFTRSIGNSMIEGIGVSSDPEVLSCDLSTNDDMLIIASNGVFEFLTNQEVIDICSASCNPLQASEDVTKAAYNKSIEHKNHCTDLTIIVCFLSSAYQPSYPEDIAVSTHSLAGMDTGR